MKISGNVISPFKCERQNFCINGKFDR